MNILLTWDSKWLWKAIYEDLSGIYTVFWVSRSWDYKFDLSKDILDISRNFKEIDFDVLILNAWVWYFGDFNDWCLEKYEEIINLNLLANIRLLKNLNISKKTKIIFIWSIISKKFMKAASVYQASKFAIRWLAWWLKKEWYKVYLINPKILDTEFHPYHLDLKNFPKTNIKDIVKLVQNIINGLETRFEIDL